jgi:hypothetical protein
MKMVTGMMLLLISQLHAITNAVGTIQQSTYILHPSIGAVFFDVTHLVDLTAMRLIRFRQPTPGFQFGSWGSKCYSAVG